MSESRSIRSLGVERPGQAYFFSYEEGPLPPDHFQLETLYSGISAGTELTFFHGTNPYLQAVWDQEFGLFRNDQPSVGYPVPFLGYMEVGRVIASRTLAVQEGEIVAMAYGHKSGHSANALTEFFVPVPPDLDPLLAIYLAQMGPICANGLLHAAADQVGRHVHDLGDGVRGRNVVIMGAGVVGLLTALFASQAGAANVAIVTNTAARRMVAEKLGLTVIDESAIEPWRFCKELWRYGVQDRGADLVFQCKVTTSSLQAALRCLRPQGTVIDLAFYQGDATALRLGEEFHHNCLTIRSAQINHIPLGLGRIWHRHRLAAETLALLRAYGNQLLENVITDRVPFERAPAFMSTLAASYQPQVLQAVLEMPGARSADLANRAPAVQRSEANVAYVGANHDH